MIAEGSGRDSFCPHFQKAMELIGRRWSGTILRALLDGPRRFSEISAAIPQITDRALSLRLK
ncbi:MAG: helix-turn-helix transcriptional regulator, partial [Actinomycetota bacterium]|nr:helix-turn-helix transcriptional regulator [Actinomycetota bacterium]